MKAETISTLRKTAFNTSLQVAFCDKNGQKHESFLPTEEVFVQLTFTNPTKEDAYVVLHQRNFGRGGILVSLDGQDGRFRNTSRGPQYVVAKISPGKSHTFRQRKLCGGPKMETEHHRNPELVPFYTPADPGTYNLTVSGWKGSFPLCIRSDGSDEDSKLPGI